MIKSIYYTAFFYLFKGDKKMEKEILERLKDLLDEEDKEITIILEGTPIINIYVGSEE